MTPLRQFKGVPSEVVRKAEGKQFPWYRYFDLVSELLTTWFLSLIFLFSRCM